MKRAARQMLRVTRREINAKGETVTLSHGATTATAMGRKLSDKSEALTDSVDQRVYKYLVLADGLSITLEQGATKLTASDGTFRLIEEPCVRRIGTTAIAYELTVSG